MAVPNTSTFKRLQNALSFFTYGIYNVIFNSKKIGKNYDVVLGTSGVIFTALLAWIYAWLNDKPFIFEIRDITYKQMQATGRSKGSLSVRIMKFLELFLCKKAEKVVVVTNGFKKTLVEEGIPQNKIEVMLILPTTYFGPVEWYRRFCSNSSDVLLEVMESFPKQTYRNRCTIGTPDGPLTLSVPVKRADSKQLTRDVEISYQQKWQHQHWIALKSAYKRTPYFDYYADFLRPFYEKETRFLVDFNEEIHGVVRQLLMNKVSLAHSPMAGGLPLLCRTAEWQGQDLEYCFGDGCSILDMLFEYGPETIIRL
jgi:hypothetical protein